VSAFNFTALSSQPGDTDNIDVRLAGTLNSVANITDIAGNPITNPFNVSAAGGKGSWGFNVPPGTVYDIWWVEGAKYLAKQESNTTASTRDPQMTLRIRSLATMQPPEVWSNDPTPAAAITWETADAPYGSRYLRINREPGNTGTGKLAYVSYSPTNILTGAAEPFRLGGGLGLWLRVHSAGGADLRTTFNNTNSLVVYCYPNPTGADVGVAWGYKIIGDVQRNYYGLATDRRQMIWVPLDRGFRIGAATTNYPSGAVDGSTPFKMIQIRTNSITDGDYVDVLGVFTLENEKATIELSFDDSESGVWNNIWPDMRSRGWPGSVYYNQQTQLMIPSMGETYSPTANRLTLDQLRIMHDDGGWDIHNHGLTHGGVTTPTMTYVHPTLEKTVTVLVATDVFTCASPAPQIGAVINFTTTNTLPSNLAAGTPYYVKTRPSATTFTVSAEPGGVTTNVLDTGTGTHYFASTIDNLVPVLYAREAIQQMGCFRGSDFVAFPGNQGYANSDVPTMLAAHGVRGARALNARYIPNVGRHLVAEETGYWCSNRLGTYIPNDRYNIATVTGQYGTTEQIDALLAQLDTAVKYKMAMNWYAHDVGPIIIGGVDLTIEAWQAFRDRIAFHVAAGNLEVTTLSRRFDRIYGESGATYRSNNRHAALASSDVV
jgi:hypothetical protein